MPCENVFMGIHTIRPVGAEDILKILETQVEKSDIMLVLIEKQWISATDPETGRRKLDNRHDFVRIEVRKALSHGIPVVPVLLNGAPMPDRDALPEDMKELARQNAAFVEFGTFDADIERLKRVLGLKRV